MKHLILKTMTIVLLVLAFPALAACPVHGRYRSLDGVVDLGRASEAWCGGNEHAGMPGNTIDAMSYDGVLGSQWHMWGMAVDAAGAQLMGSSLDPNGTGWVDYSTNYVGGQFWLSGDVAWSDDGGDLTGVIASCNVEARLTYFMGQLVGSASNIFMTGVFDGCQSCTLQFAQANGLLIWAPDPFFGAMPAGYPGFACGANLGELFDICSVDLSIQCEVPADATTWGNVKALFH